MIHIYPPPPSPLILTLLQLYAIKGAGVDL